MAKKTFENLEKEKKEKIYESLKEFFEEEDLKNINVSEIVKKLNYRYMKRWKSFRVK